MGWVKGREKVGFMGSDDDNDVYYGSDRERRWVLLKIPRCDIDGVGEGK